MLSPENVTKNSEIRKLVFGVNFDCFEGLQFLVRVSAGEFQLFEVVFGVDELDARDGFHEVVAIEDGEEGEGEYNCGEEGGRGHNFIISGFIILWWI